MESPRSPKRRRILSSINPPESDTESDVTRKHKRDRTMTPRDSAPLLEDDKDDDGGGDDRANRQGTENQSELRESGMQVPRPTKFRFKSKSSRSRRHEGDEDNDNRHRRRHRHRHRSQSRSRSRDRERRRHRGRDDRSRERGGDGNDDSIEEERRRKRSHRHHHHHRRSHRRKHRSTSPGPKTTEGYRDDNNDPFQDPPLSPNTAFRESLFDAMADDEGAAYWESVYGQPIHIYAPPGGEGGAGGTLEQMTDEEYAAYVRQKMWERTHAGLLEARARRERERAEAHRVAEEQARIDREMERCLRRGEERRRRREWKGRWEGYMRRWKEWEEKGAVAGEGGGAIPWPVIGGSGDDESEETVIRGEDVRAFFVNGIGLDEVGEKEFAARLKEERVRWHPDKVQQRLGGKVDEIVMRNVTAVFQVVDALWNDTRKHSG
ncbi:hypothetical protein C7999DRAFT_27028 [Corynascus novoguineensis]|uniref:Uncharacterized protein n=1 Tax=Corynascus novoguineensis TaxID=1126955 RepID=A0AAN7HVE3_9PEZI|nr:hypothetical protein C7999DRAFT_27028 [Corynascus novoguineensis]